MAWLNLLETAVAIPDDEELPDWAFERTKEMTDQGDYYGFCIGHKYCHDCTLVTNNTKDFKNIDGLTIVDWSRQ